MTLRRFVIATILAVTIEDARRKKVRAIVAGVRDFLLGHSGPAPTSVDLSVDEDDRDGIAVVLVTHNGMRFLEEQLASIAGQSTKPDAVYLVDDRSSDGSGEYVVDYFASHGSIPVVVVRAPEICAADLYTRIAANFEAGMRAAASEYRYIALSDQDDIWEADRLAMQRDRLSTGRALLTVGDASLIDQDGVLTGRRLREHFPVPASWHESTSAERMRILLRHPIATGAAMMVDSRIVRYATPVPAGWLHDRWLSLVGAAVDAIDVDDRIVVRYRISPSQVVGTRGTDKSGWNHLSEGGSRPYLAARKIGHLSGRLRALADSEPIRAELSLYRVLRSYLVPRGRDDA
ncbi:glycosyltransferase [Rhodococcus pyridinivorans]